MNINDKLILLITKQIRYLQKQSSFQILILATIVGAFTGLMGSLFQLSVNFIIDWNKNFTKESYISNNYLNCFLIFIITALMGAFSYYLVKRFAPESSGSGIPEVEGAF